ncbi:MAG: glutamine synthetase III [Ruminococcus sp.]|nr:glutamine synthetase III [Candidatus Apopatosoma intestinale]
MNISEEYGCLVFNETAMKKYLSAPVYLRLSKMIEEGKDLTPEIADAVAEAMKDWAISLGATHFTHWFQPLTGITAEKHDSFLSTGSKGILMDFSGKELIKGEPDASSFPSGGIRTTFEARGYTAWDATSYAFIKDDTLCIPTAFCSYGGESLDKKTPLLRSMEAIGTQALRVLKALGYTDVGKVFPSVGAEQEYFLIDKDLYDSRPDLVFSGRTLYGARPPKGQELNDHYFGSIKPRVKEFMADLDRELWKLGIPAKTEHNEVAPSQHELAVIYTTANMATDHNQLVMEIMKKVANRHHLACLLHEKPFDGINGSGKHNNWSLSTDTGINLLDPGDTPYGNTVFLLMVCAVIRAVDKHQDLFRASVAGAGNDHRLGAGEAPPSIISVFLGDELTSALAETGEEPIHEKKNDDFMKTGVRSLPKIPRDSTDRNRTSPVAFTGNKFEFRMPGASASIADINTVINTTLAESLDHIATALENSNDPDDTLRILIRETSVEHGRILYSGNCYSEEWEKEAERRGLLKIASTPEALSFLVSDKNKALFAEYGVLSPTELEAHYEILLDNYVKTLKIEACSMIDMARKQFLPSITAYSSDLARSVSSKKSLSDALDVEGEITVLSRLCTCHSSIYRKSETLSALLSELEKVEAVVDQAKYTKESVIPAMQELRTAVDEAEMLMGESYWPIPSYSKLLFSI